MVNKSGEEIVINDVNLVTYNNAFIIQWDSNIGWGEMTFYKDKDGINVETECMSNNDDKRFIKLVLDKFIEKLEVVE